MKAVRFHEHGGPSVLRVDEIDRPTPGADELLVRIHAAGVNPVDVKYREGTADPLPAIAGSDFAGTVESVGAAGSGFEVGDRVFGTGLHNNALRTGTYAEYVAVRTDLVAPLPDEIGFEAGAAVGLAGVTAWRGLIDRAGLEPGDACLIHGGSGGVGHLAVQIAAAAGATVVATAAPAYHESVAALGADVVLDYDRPDLAAATREAVGRGVDVVFDHRLDEYVGLDVEVCGFGGAVVGIDGGEVTIPDASLARSKELAIHHVGMDNFLRPALPSMATVLARLTRLVERGDLRPTIARTYSLAEAAAAQRDVRTDSYLGKLVIVP